MSIGAVLQGERQWHIECGDAIEVMANMPDECVDLIVTDPPYGLEYVHLFGATAMAAARILKPKGFFYAYCGAHYLPTMLPDMAEYLTWFWLYRVYHRGGIPRFWSKRIMETAKSVLAFTNGVVPQNEVKWSASDFLHDWQDKSMHRWGQGGGFALRHIELRTELGDVVLDPFCGGGSFCGAAHQRKRRWLGIDIDPQSCELTRQRIVEIETGLTRQEQAMGQAVMFGDTHEDQHFQGQ